MAIKPYEKYTPAANPPDASYPQGSFKNDSIPGDLSGSPLEKDWPNDFFGYFQKLLDYAGITPSGNPDTILASDYFDALIKRINAQSPYYVDSGVANAIIVTADPPFTAYTEGMKLRVKIAVTNTGAVTINVDSLGIKNVKKQVNTALVAGDLPAGSIIDLIYDGTNFLLELINHGHSGLGDGGALGQMLATDLTLTGAAASPPDANTTVKDNIVKGWINFKGTGTISINDSYNVLSIVDDGEGQYIINWDTDFADANYAVVGMAKKLSGDATSQVGMSIQKDAGLTVGSTTILLYEQDDTTIDPEVVTLIAIGNQT